MALETLVRTHNGRLVGKWWHYLPIYERYFKRYLGEPVRILEIGVCEGGSLEIWLKYFGKDCSIYGIDIDPKAKLMEAVSEKIKIYIGDQGDRNWLENLDLPMLDIIIDDGSHLVPHQIASFEALFPKLKPGGIYLAEDLHTSYWEEYQFGSPISFVDYMKGYIDKINAYWRRDGGVDIYTETLNSITFYDSMVVVEKANIKRDHPEGFMLGRFKLQDGSN